MVPMSVDAMDEAGWKVVGPGGRPPKGEPTIASLMAAIDGIGKRLAAGGPSPSLGAVGPGKGGGGKGGTMGKGGTGCHNCGGPHLIKDCPHPKPAKGDGKGAGKGKGKGKPGRPGWQICRKFSETGRCPHREQYGYCRFAHVRPGAKGPLPLGAVFEDVASHAVLDSATGEYAIPDDAAVNMANLAAVVASELEAANGEGSISYVEEGGASESPDLKQGFTWLH